MADDRRDPTELDGMARSDVSSEGSDVAVLDELAADMKRCGAELDKLTAQRTSSDAAAAARLTAQPWVGQVRVQEAGERRTYRVGEARLPGLRIVDWRHPLGTLLFTGRIGEEYERPGPKIIEGQLHATYRVVPEGRTVNDARFADEGGDRRVVRATDLTKGEQDLPRVRVRPRGVERLGSALPYLTPEQFRLIARTSDKPLIITGKAGSGKTTVGIHRVSWLTWGHPADVEGGETIAPGRALDPEKILIVMFNKPLVRWVRGLLPSVGLQKAKLSTFHGWALDAIHAAYDGKIELFKSKSRDRRLFQSLKGHAGFLSVLDEHIEKQEERLLGWLEPQLTGAHSRWLHALREKEGSPVRRIMEARHRIRAELKDARGATKAQLEEAAELFKRAWRKMTRYKEELRSIVTDVELLERHLTGVARSDLEKLAAYQDKMQEGESGHAGFHIDFEDVALLLYLIEKKSGGLPRGEESIEHFDHVLIDEAQDFGAVQLHVLLGALRARTGITIVGDANQKILPHVPFVGWSSVAKIIGLEGSEIASLEVGHRSTAPIMRLAEHVLGAKGNSDGRTGPKPALLRVRTLNEATARIAAAASGMLRADPTQHIVVVLPFPTDVPNAADALAIALGQSVPVRIGRGDDFEFSAGITVTSRLQVKGLEFGSVIVLDNADLDTADVHVRHQLYVVITRAVERLVVVVVGKASKTMADAEALGLLVDEDDAPM